MSEQTFHFIPTRNIDQDFLRSVPDICGIAFVRHSYFDMGILIAHEGVLIDRSNLVHASSELNYTGMVDFLEYLNNNGGPRFDGVMIYKFTPAPIILMK